MSLDVSEGLATAPVRLAPHTFSLIVFGIPAPQGSKRYLGNGRAIESNAPVLASWRDDVRRAALEALDRTGHYWEGNYPAIVAHIAFTLPRPRSHYRHLVTGDRLKPDAPRLVGTKPDLDKLLRSTFDALASAGVYPDDSRLAQVHAVKVYPSSVPSDGLDRPGARIVLSGVKR